MNNVTTFDCFSHDYMLGDIIIQRNRVYPNSFDIFIIVKITKDKYTDQNKYLAHNVCENFNVILFTQVIRKDNSSYSYEGYR